MPLVPYLIRTLPLDVNWMGAVGPIRKEVCAPYIIKGSSSPGLMKIRVVVHTQRLNGRTSSCCTSRERCTHGRGNKKISGESSKDACKEYVPGPPLFYIIDPGGWSVELLSNNTARGGAGEKPLSASQGRFPIAHEELMSGIFLTCSIWNTQTRNWGVACRGAGRASNRLKKPRGGGPSPYR